MGNRNFYEKCREALKSPKQLIVAVVILLVAAALLTLSFYSKQEKPVVKPQVVVTTETVVEEEIVSEDIPVVEEEIISEEVVITDEEGEDTTVEEEVVEEEAKQADCEKTKEVIKIAPENVMLTFTATTEKDFDFQVYYTVENDIWFDESHKINFAGQEGTHDYTVVIPKKKVYRVRIDFDKAPGKVNIKNIRLVGSQENDLNNFALYELHQIKPENVKKDIGVHPDISLFDVSDGLTFVSDEEDPYIAYQGPLVF